MDGLSRDPGPFLGSAHLPSADCTPGNRPQPLPHQGVDARLLRALCPPTCAAGSHATHLPSSQVQLSTNLSRFQPQCPTPRCSFRDPHGATCTPSWPLRRECPSPSHTWTHPSQVTCNLLWALITGQSRMLAATSLTQRACLAVSFWDLGCALYWWPELPVARTRRSVGCRPSVDTE